MTRLMSFFSLLFLLATATTDAATITIGTGTNLNTTTTYPAPYGNFFWGAKHQFLITATELTTAGMLAGNINNMSFVVNQAQGTGLQGFTISMKNTATATLTAFETGLTTVLTPASYTETNGLNTHTFPTPFYWDGVSNLVIETCFNNSTWTGNATTFYTNTSYASSVYFRQDSPNVCSSNTVTQSLNMRPNIIFDWSTAAIPPNSNFTANTTYTCSGVVNFTDLSTNTPTAWTWDFGDGFNSSLQNPTHTYLGSGVYNVSLIACNAYGCDTTTFSNYITVNLSAPLPVPVSCTPNTLSYCCGFGITNFSFATINNSSSDGISGYSDFTCTQASILEGQTYSLSIQTLASSTQNYAVWIDFNNDGVFNDVTERIYTASSQLNTSGNITIPTGAVLGVPLRLRVTADYDFSPPPTPCLDPTYGQTEDYTIIINANPNPPVPIFSASPLFSCDGTICFNDLSLNVPVLWLWDFGDGNTSFQQNPCHTYSTNGTYTIKLTVTNGNGANTDSIVNYVTVNTGNQLLAPSCMPASTAYCCAYGIYQVDFNTISHPSLDGTEGYQDFSCQNTTTVTEGSSYTLTVKTGVNNPQDTRAWIDFNNDGVFNNTNELIMDAPNSYNPSVNYSIPTGGVLSTALRMRISSDIVGTAQSGCDANDFGQTEDYGIIIQPNITPPINNFSASVTTTCSDTICFTDLTTNLPTTWLWYFGDGDTSSLQNPCHYYPIPGLYTVSLVTTNIFGQDSLAMVNYINVNCNNVTVPTSGIKNIIACNGTLYDNGGQSSNYSNNTDGVVVIQPNGASMVSLNFTFFDFRTQQPGDTLFIYDGPTTGSPLLGSFTGNGNPGVINSTGGSITIRQKTNIWATDPGFALTWSCFLINVPELSTKSDNYIVYPNPTSEIINIKSLNIKQGSIKEMKLFNAVGQAVMTYKPLQKKSLLQINVSQLPKGLYFLSILSDQGLISKKINIQ